MDEKKTPKSLSNAGCCAFYGSYVLITYLLFLGFGGWTREAQYNAMVPAAIGAVPATLLFWAACLYMFEKPRR